MTDQCTSSVALLKVLKRYNAFYPIFAVACPDHTPANGRILDSRLIDGKYAEGALIYGFTCDPGHTLYPLVYYEHTFSCRVQDVGSIHSQHGQVMNDTFYLDNSDYVTWRKNLRFFKMYHFLIAVKRNLIYAVYWIASMRNSIDPYWAEQWLMVKWNYISH